MMQPAAGPRVKDKFVSLPDELEDAAAPVARQHTLDLPSTVFEVRAYMLLTVYIALLLTVLRKTQNPLRHAAGYSHRPAC